MPERMLVALGGHALLRPGGDVTLAEQEANVRECLRELVEIVRRGHPLVLTHGNGPQVGAILIRSEEARGRTYELPLDACVAQSQGEIGYLIQRTLRELLAEAGLERPVATVLTQSLVDPEDPLLQTAVKPVGPVYPPNRRDELEARGYELAPHPDGGVRRTVPSPRPVRVLEADVVRTLIEKDVIVVAAGGGGIPVKPKGMAGLRGVEAVIDKDYASALVAAATGVSTLIFVTAVDHVKLDFGTERERDLETLTVAEARRYLAEGHFAPGTMRPKVEAAIDFLERGGQRAVVTAPGGILRAWSGRGGTEFRR